MEHIADYVFRGDGDESSTAINDDVFEPWASVVLIEILGLRWEAAVYDV